MAEIFTITTTTTCAAPSSGNGILVVTLRYSYTGSGSPPTDEVPSTLYLKNPQGELLRQFPAGRDSVLELDNLADGDYNLEWVETDSGNILSYGGGTVTCAPSTDPPPDPEEPDPIPTPTLVLLTEDSGYVGDSVELTGTLFTGATKVLFSGKSIPFTVISDSTIQVTVPSGITSGDVGVEVGTQSTNTLPFTLLEIPIPPPPPSPEIPGWCISWQLDFNSWTGEHTTLPTWYLTRNLDTYRVLGSQVVKQEVDSYGLPLTLTWSANDNPLVQKSFDNLVLEQEITDSSLAQPFLRYQTFSTLEVSTTFHHTGTLVPHVPLSYADKWGRVNDPTQVLASFEKDQYNLEIPGSVVVDVDGDITSPGNWNLTKPFKPRVSGKWALFTLTYQGSITQKMLLHTARVVSRLIPR